MGRAIEFDGLEYSADLTRIVPLGVLAALVTATLSLLLVREGTLLPAVTLTASVLAMPATIAALIFLARTRGTFCFRVATRTVDAASGERFAITEMRDPAGALLHRSVRLLLG